MDEGSGARGTEEGAALLYHGGNLTAARKRFAGAPLPWLDLSTGINPVFYTVGDVSAASWTRLPDPADQARLEAVAATAYGAGNPACVVAAPGTQALIQMLPVMHPARRVGILDFTYSEHALCWRAAGASVTQVDTVEALGGFDVAVVVNPNNPDGRIVQPAVLANLAGTLARAGGLLVVDEAFADVLADDVSVIPTLLPRTIVLRSFGKTYGLAGLRLGFAVAEPALAAPLRASLGPWAVSGPALDIGTRALADAVWLVATRQRLNRDAAKMDAMLAAAGLAVIGGTPLYRLARHERAADLFEALGGEGVLVRAFAGKPNWLRFGLPGSKQDWTLFETRLHHACARLGEIRQG